MHTDSTDSSNSILILGTGAMACLFAARLSAAKYSVIMLGTWLKGLEALEQHGVRVVEADDREQAFPVQVARSSRTFGKVRYAFVLVKSWQTERAAQQLAECLAPDGLVLCLQNGLGNRETLSEIIGAGRVVIGTTTAGATLLEPGRVRPAGEGVVSLGAHPGVTTLAKALRVAGFIVENAPDANALLWGKLVINAAINPLTAILGIRNGELLERKTAHSLLTATAREAAAVAVAQGVHLPYPDPVIAAETIARRTAHNLSSMLQDIQRGAPTEIDAICGAIVQAGEQTGVPIPINRTLWQLVKAMTDKP